MFYKVTFLVSYLGLAVLSLHAQQSSDGAWKHTDEAAKKTAKTLPLEPWISPKKFADFSLNTVAFKKTLAKAGSEKSTERKEPKQIIELPMPDGALAKFRIIESPIMEPALAAKFPEIKTYRGVGVTDTTATLRMTLTPDGFSAQILRESGASYIDRLFKENSPRYASYRRDDYQHQHIEELRAQEAAKESEGDDSHSHEDHVHGFQCLVESPDPLALPSTTTAERTAARSSGGTLSTYRIAVATTGEYTSFHGGTVANGQAAVVTAINRVTGVFEQELAVRLVLVANNDLLIYTNSGTDPYDNNDAGQMINVNTSTINGIIGDASYDIGHVFSTGGGGLAGLGVVCGLNKGAGVTGLPSPTGDPFWIDFVAHEIGHQYGANHTFNGNQGSCSGGNRNSSTAYEPGSGSTIMAYAGICGSDNIQSNSNPIFSAASYDEIRALVESVGCAVDTATGNSVPTVNAGSNYTIPANTPFELTASGSDADSGDSLTYLWEERDLGPSNGPNDPDNGSSPLFRVWVPTASPTRTFPRLSDLINNTTVIGEQLPTMSRTMNFRATVRDNRAGGGGVNQDDMQVTVTNTAGPFQVTAPNTSGLSLSGTTTVTWNVANTSSAPVNTSQVKILLSTDGGNTYPTVLSSSTPNDGSETVSLPSINTSTARIKVQAENNIYFDISNNNFTITPTAGPSLSLANIALAEGDSGTQSAVFTVTLSPTASETVTVNYATANGTATAGSDYTAASGQLQFPAGTTSQQVTIDVTGDTTVETDETFFLNLSNPTNASLSSTQGICTIQNDDVVAPVITSADTALGSLGSAFSYQITANNNPTSFGVTGSLPAGVSLNTSSGLFFGTPTVTGTFPVTISATNSAGSDTAPLTITIVENPINSAVDNSDLTFTQGGNAPWTLITGTVPTTQDGVDAARSGVITNSQESWIETTVTGPDTLSFYWKVSSEQNFDFLRVLLDGSVQQSISGNQDWTQVLLPIPAGTHTVRWSYLKDGSESAGSDAGFLDSVFLASASPSPIITSSTHVTAAKDHPFCYEILTVNEPTSYQATELPSGLNIDTSTGIIRGKPTTNGTFSVNLTATNANGSSNATMTLIVGDLLALGEALETTPSTFAWIGGSTPWTSQTSVTNDGVDAAASGSIGDNQESTLMATVKGPDLLMFYWKVGSESGFDFLAFELDGIEEFSISGNVDWQKRTVFIPEGSHSLTWKYKKDGSVSTAPDTGYLDQVSLLSETFTVSDFDRTGSNAQITFPTQTGITYTVWFSSNLEDWTPVQENITGTGAPIVIPHTGGASAENQFYRVTATPSP